MKTIWNKKVISWIRRKTLYLSVPFTWQLSDAEKMAREHKGKVVAGGPAVKLMGAPWADEIRERAPCDVLSLHNPDATFTTRGCPRKCSFCAVPRIEGAFRELKRWKIRPIECSNNFLAASKTHIVRVISSFICLPEVDFNQGLDARLFTPWHARQLARLRKVHVRFSLDHVGMASKVAGAIDIARKAGLKRFGVYVLIGYKDTPDDALYRLDLVRSWGIRPNPMRYQPLDCVARDEYIAPGWNAKTLKHMMRFYSRLAWLPEVAFEDYVDYEENREAKRKGRIK